MPTTPDTHMDYDCLIIGGGIAGLTCGIKCLTEGLSCAILSTGMSALHFSSGSLDLLGHFPGREVVYSPLDVLPDFIDQHPDHPYARCGTEKITEALDFFRSQAATAGFPLYSNGCDNHFHVTAIGTLKPSFLSSTTVFNSEIKTAFEKRPSIMIVNVRGFRDFHPRLAAANLKQNPFFSECGITCREVDLPIDDPTSAGSHGMRSWEMRSIDIARLFDKTSDLRSLARRIVKPDENVDVVGIPAFLGIDRFREIIDELQRATGTLIYEVPTLPPSILGMRLDNALKSRFAALGGVFIAGETVDGSVAENNRITAIHTARQDDMLHAHYYVLATGSFFSKGITSRFGKMSEPVFDLSLGFPDSPEAMSAKIFFSPNSHNFINSGVVTDHHLRPQTRSGKTIDNLFCAGAILAHYNPVGEGSGSGVAIATGYKAGQQIAEQVNR